MQISHIMLPIVSFLGQHTNQYYLLREESQDKIITLASYKKLHDARTTGKELTAAMTSYKGEIT